jgi:hypothetical protein
MEQMLILNEALQRKLVEKMREISHSSWQIKVYKDGETPRNIKLFFLQTFE